MPGGAGAAVSPVPLWYNATDTDWGHMDATPQTWRRWLWRRLGRALLLAVLIPGWLLCVLGVLSAASWGLTSRFSIWQRWTVPSAAVVATLPFGSNVSLSGWGLSLGADAVDGAVAMTAASDCRGHTSSWEPTVGPDVRGFWASPQKGHVSWVDNDYFASDYCISRGAYIASGAWLPLVLFLGGPALVCGACALRRRRRGAAASALPPTIKRAHVPVHRAWSPLARGPRLLARIGLWIGLVMSGVLAVACLASLFHVHADASIDVFPNRDQQFPTARITRNPGDITKLSVSVSTVRGGIEFGVKPRRYTPSDGREFGSWTAISMTSGKVRSLFLWLRPFRSDDLHEARFCTQRDYFLTFGGWVPCTVFLMLAAIALTRWLRGPYRRRYRRRHNLCLICGYNLTGNTSGRCPECGTAVPPAAGDAGAAARLAPLVGT